MTGGTREPDQFFWLDDAFGPTQYESMAADAWNRVTPSIAAALRGGARLVVTPGTTCTPLHART